MNVSDLISELQKLPQDEDLQVLVDEVDEDDPIEEGDILTIQPDEVGGYVRGMRVIRVRKT